MAFQFQLVRLKCRLPCCPMRSTMISIPTGSIKIKFRRLWSSRPAISIPTGSIKIYYIYINYFIRFTFQFQLVRLKYPPRADTPDVETAFQFQLVRLKYWQYFFIVLKPRFQFQLVRLKLLFQSI